MLREVDILEAVLSKQRPNKLGKLSMPPSRSAPTSDCASAGPAQSPSSSRPALPTTEAPERNCVSVLLKPRLRLSDADGIMRHVAAVPHAK